MARNPRLLREKAFSKPARPPDPELTVYTRLVRRGWLKRTIQITGDAEAMIEYAASWIHTTAVVRVNGVEVARVTSGVFPPRRHHLLFTLPTCHGPASASISAELLAGDFLARLVYLSLTIGGVLRYREGEGRVLIRPQPSTPIPASAPTPDADSLPRPTDPPDPDAETLPRVVDALSEQEPEERAPWWRFGKR